MPTQEDIQHQMNMLEIHRRNIRHYQGQMRMLGPHTPPGVFSGLETERRGVARIKSILRGWDLLVSDTEIDTASGWEIEMGVEV